MSNWKCYEVDCDDGTHGDVIYEYVPDTKLNCEFGFPVKECSELKDNNTDDVK